MIDYKHSRKLILSYFLLAALLFLYIGVNKPTLNWDMIGYVAVVKSYTIKDTEALHQEVYDDLKDFVNAQHFQTLNEFNQKRIDVYNSPVLLKHHLPFYSIRPVYTGLIYLASIIGISEYRASYLIPAVFASAALFLMYFLITNNFLYPLSYSIPVFFIAFGGLSLFKLSTPDGLVFFFLVLCSLFAIKNYKYGLLSMVPLAVLLRTDLIIFSFLVCIWLFFKKTSLGLTILSLLLSILILLTINHLAGSFGWATLIHYSFVERVSDPSAINATIGFENYLQIVISQLPKFLRNAGFTFFLGLTIVNIVLFRCLNAKERENSSLQFFVFIPPAYVLVHVVLFPAVWNRFFIGFYLMALLGFLFTISILTHKKNQKNNHPSR